MNATTATIPTIDFEARIREYATCLGWQSDGCGGGVMLWNLIRDIPGHPEGSTVAQATVEKAIIAAELSRP